MIVDVANKYIGKDMEALGFKDIRYATQSWSARFVLKCDSEAGYAYNGNLVDTDNAVTMYNALPDIQRRDNTYVPHAGDLMFFKGGAFSNGHVAIISSVSDSDIQTINGDWQVIQLTAGSRHVRIVHTGMTIPRKSIENNPNYKYHSQVDLTDYTFLGYGIIDPANLTSEGVTEDEYLANSPDNPAHVAEYKSPKQRDTLATEKPGGRYMAYWNGLVWKLSYEMVKPLQDFSTSYTLATKSERADGVTTSVTPIGINAQTISFSYLPLYGNLVKTLNDLRAYVGAYDFFYLGSGRVGSNPFRLTRVACGSDGPLKDGSLPPSHIHLTFTEVVDYAEGDKRMSAIDINQERQERDKDFDRPISPEKQAKLKEGTYIYFDYSKGKGDGNTDSKGVYKGNFEDSTNYVKPEAGSPLRKALDKYYMEWHIMTELRKPGCGMVITSVDKDGYISVKCERLHFFGDGKALNIRESIVNIDFSQPTGF